MMILHPPLSVGALFRSALVLSALLVCSAPPAAAQESRASRDPAILPGDVIRLQVWREEEWSGDFLVDQFGVATLPLMGDVNVRGETQRSLKAKVQSALRAEVFNPSIQLLVLKRIRVLGEVLDPGVFTLDPTMTVADALAMAGGRSPLAVEGPVTLRRGGETVTTDVVQDTYLSDLAIQTGDEILVRQRSWMSRNGGAVMGAAAGLLGLIVAVVVR